MKNIIYLSPNFPVNFISFSKALKKAGGRVLGLGDEPYEMLKPELKEVLTEYYKVDNMHDYEQLYKGVAFLAFKYGKIHRIDSQNEYWLDTEAKLREDFNICGMKPSQLSNARSKAKMKKVFRELGFKVAEGEVVIDLEDAQKFVKKVGYPVVVKPDSGVGAADTCKVTCDEELNRIFETPAENYIMEEFITGQIHSFDGLANSNCEPMFMTSHVFSNGIMDVVNKKLNMYYYSVKDLPAKLEEMGKKCLKAFGVKSRFFHFEFFYTSKGEYIPLEVNLRPPGGLSMDMFNYACDIDLYKTWAEMIVNGVEDFTYDRKKHVLYVGKKDGKEYANDHKSVMDNYGDAMILNQEIPQVFSSALGHYGYMASSEELERLIEMAEFTIEEK